MMAQELALLWPEITVLLSAVGALVAEMLRRPRLALAVGVAGLLIATGLTLPLLGTDTTVFGGTLRIDVLGVWAKLILLPATALSLLLARAELGGTAREGTVYSLLCFASFGALVLAGSGDVMFLVLGTLLTGLASFALVAYPGTASATEGAVKFFVYGSVTGAVMIFGLTYWYGATGSTLLSELRQLDAASLACAAGLVAVVVGLGYKASLVPFHFWAPDAYQGGPLSVAAYLSVVPKIAALFALAQVMRDLPLAGGWPQVLAAIAVLTMTFGYLAALGQQHLVRLLAYSSIAQSGYFLLGVIAVGSSPLALASLIVFAAAYAAMNLGAFAVLAGTGRTLDAVRGLGRSRPLIAAAMVVFLISLVGMPPLGGFAGKFLLFGAAMDSGYAWLAVAAILNSVLSLAVYLRIVVPMYRRAEAETPMPSGTATLPWTVTLIALVLTVGIGLGAQLLLTWPGAA